MAADDQAGNTARNVSPLSSTERVRRHRQRRKEARLAASGLAGPGNTLAVTHGAFSAALTGPMAERITADLLADPGTPLWLRERSYAPAVAAWAQAEAEVLRLRAWRDDLERAGAGAGEMLTEETSSTEHESRPTPGELERVGRVRQRESLARALSRAEGRAKSLRADLGLTPASRAKLGSHLAKIGKVDLAQMWADEDAAERGAGS